MEYLLLIRPIHIALGLLGLAFCIQVYFYSRYYFAIIRTNRKRKKAPTTNDEMPPVSIVICAKDESINLREFLPIVLEQDYPNYEVIVVNDGNTEPTKEVIAKLTSKYPHLKETFIPMNARVISRKKLALTVGIKAAANDIILLTDADCRPNSDQWIKQMVRHFEPGTEVVVGYGAYEQKKGLLSRMISYDTLFTCMQYMGFALNGKPYMGVGRNMAYKRSTFFERNGFADMLHMQSGDDDLYVQAIANKDNTKVEFGAESKTISLPKTTFKEWIRQRMRHLSTSTSYKGGTINRIGWEVMSRGLFYAAFIACIYYWDLTLSLIAIGLLLVRYTLQCCSVNISAKIMEERKFWSSILFFDMLLPVLNLLIMLSNALHRRKKFNWK